MRPALYYPWVYLKGGAERVLLELLRRSRHDWTLYTNRYDRESTFPELSDFRIVQLREIPVRRSILDVTRAAGTLLWQRLDLQGHDGLLVVSEGLGNIVASRSRIATSCLCLTPLKVAYDPVTRERFFAGRLRPHYRAAFAAYRLAERGGWRRYVRVFCISDEVRRRILAGRLAEDVRLEVLYPGIDTERYRPGCGTEPFVLVPGRIMWQKNIELAIEAMKLCDCGTPVNRVSLTLP